MNRNTLQILASAALGLMLVAPAGAQSPFFQAVTNLNPTAYWPMHETTAPGPGSVETNYGTLGRLGDAFFADWVGNSGVGREIPGALANDPDTSLAFSGSRPSYLLVPHTSPATTLIPPFTIECWAQGTNNTFADILGQAGATLNGNGTDANKNGVRLCWGGNNATAPDFQVYVGYGTGQRSFSSGPNYVIGQWYYLVLTCDATTNFSLYVNGTLMGSAQYVDYVPSAWNPLTIGASFWGDSGGNYPARLLKGYVDEVAVYTNVLVDADMSAHYSAGTSGAAGEYAAAVLSSSPLLYFRMNSPAYNPPDVSTWAVLNNYGSATVNGVYRPELRPAGVGGPDNRFGGFAGGFGTDTNAAPCNGLSAFADGGFAPEFNVPYNAESDTPFSVAAWFKGNPTDPRNQRLVSHGNGSWCLRWTTYGFVRFETGASQNLGGPAVNDGQWHYVVATHEGNTNTIYLDGVQAARGVNAGYTNGVGSSLPVMIGADPSYTNNPVGPGQQFAGNLCEVAFWNGTALSAGQVQGLYDAAGIGPKIKTQPVAATVNQNAGFTNNVVAWGSMLTYQWYHNGTARSGQISASLVLTSVQPGDEGDYYVVAQNVYGAATSSVVTLTVVSAPQITLQPAYTNLVLFAGGHATFTVGASGALPLAYQWISNGVPIVGATSNIYTLENVQLGTSASIYCLVTNLAGMTSNTPVSVSVIAAPTAPYPQAVMGAAPVSYWRLNEPDDGLGDGNPGAIAHDYWGGNNGTYTNVLLGQLGYSSITDPTETSALFGYTIASVDNYVGLINGVDFGAPTNTSSNFSIEAWVNGAGQSISGAGIVTKGYGNGGEQFNLDCYRGGVRFFVRDASGATHGYTSTISPDFSWHHIVGVCDESNGQVSLYMDGQQVGAAGVLPGSGILSSTNPVSIGARRSGASVTNYDFQFIGYLNDVAAYNYALTAEQVRAHYTAAGTAPYLMQAPSATIDCNEGAALTLPAIGAGTPPLTNTWVDTTHGTNVAQTIALSTNWLDGTLVLNSIPVGWGGTTLQLTLANAYGTTNFSISFTVHSGMPVIVQDLPPTVTTAAGKPYQYSVVVQGAEPFSYLWLSNGIALAGQNSATYSFDAASANYSVVVNNSYGSVTSRVSLLTVVAAPTNAYANLMATLGAAGYWPLQETTAPAPTTTETNLGTLGGLGTAYYAGTNLYGVSLGQAGALGAIGDNDPSVGFTFTSGAANLTNSYLFVPILSPVLALNAPLTWECWVNSSSGEFADLMGNGGAPGDGSGNWAGLRLSYNRGTSIQAYWYYGSGGSYHSLGTPSGSLSIDVWHYCALTYDGTNLLLYVDGAEMANTTTVVAPNYWTPFTVGTARWTSGPSRPYGGLIDEVAVYTNVLSALDITNHYLAGITASSNYRGTILAANPLLYYRMNGVYTNPSPLIYPDAVNFGSVWAQGKYQPGITPGGTLGPENSIFGANVAAPINGVFSGVDAGYNPAFNPVGTQPFTAMTWFKGYPWDQRTQTIMGQGQNWSMNIDGSSSRIVWNLYSGGQVTSSGVLNDGQWHFIAGVYDGTTSSLYVDGQLDGSAVAAAPLAGETNANLYLGGNCDYTFDNASPRDTEERYFSGALAQAAYFTNALTAVQIAELYATAVQPQLAVQRAGTQLIITYTGTLWSSTNVAGPYTPVTGASSPYTITPSGAGGFYRSSLP